MKAVLFDAFGTLVEIMDKRNPFGRAIANPKSDKLPFGRGRSAMIWPIDIGHITADPEIHTDLLAELLSIKVYPDVITTLHRLRTQGIKVGIISNLARPYGSVVSNLLGDHVDSCCYSYREGYLKPDANFFHLACDRLGVLPNDTMMIGDNPKNDIIGATEAGLTARIIKRPNQTIEDILRD